MGRYRFLATAGPVRGSWRRLPVVVVLVSLALVVGVFEPGAAAPMLASPLVSSLTPLSAVDGGDHEPSRPDRLSAMTTARATGARVEDESQRDEITRVYANPDGTWTAETAPEPESVLDDQGVWHDVDTTLVARDGKVEPTWSAADVWFSEGGDTTFAHVTEQGKNLDWKWTAPLPAPTLEGDTATYANVIEGGDLVVTATSTGFTHSIVLREQPSEPVEIKLPIVTHGAHVSQSEEGAIVVENAQDETLVEAPAPMMFDSSEDPAGDPQAGGLDTSLGSTASGNPQLTLTPDAGFLDDPETQYPVVIDPSFRTYTTGDTWVASDTYTSGMVSNEELRAGTYTSGARKYRSFIHFNTTAWNGKNILGADLVMRNWESASCTPGEIRATRVNDLWSAADLTWSNQPTVDASKYGSFSLPYGGTGCPSNNAFIDITAMVSDWANGHFVNHGIRLAGLNESSNATWRRYWSANYTGSSGYHPHINVTYNSRPAVPAKPSIKPVASYAAPGASSSQLYTGATKPELSTKVTDADGGTVRGVFEVKDTATGVTTTCTSAMVASGGTATCTPAADLSEKAYQVRVKADDGTDDSRKVDDQPDTAWSDWSAFTVASGTPGAPSISCPAPYTDSSWASAAPTTDLTCTVTAAGSGTSSAGRILVQVDQGTLKTIVIDQSSDPGVAKTTVSVPKTMGGHEITATAQSPSGTLSAPSTYAFGYGTVGMSLPVVDPLTVTSGGLKIDANGPPGSGTPTGSLRWRLAGSGDDAVTGWTTDAAAGLSTVADASGIHVSGTWDSGHATTSGGGTLDPRVPALLDVQVCLNYTAGLQCTWTAQHTQVMRVPHAFGDGFPTADVAGGQVSLWTGEFGLEDSDADLAAGAGGLSVGRSAYSYDGPPASPAASVFGPGWTASLDGPDAGMAGLQIIDSTRRDGTLVALDGAGNAMVFAPKTGLVRRTAADLATGTWAPVDQDTIDAGIGAKITGTGASTVLTLTELDGTSSNFKVTAAASSSTDATFVPASVVESGSGDTTTYSYDSGDRVTRILAPVPAGVTCPTSGTLPAGCRALSITYATATTASMVVPGDYAGQVKSIATVVGATSTTVAGYLYDTSGRLVGVNDPRNSLLTSYAYDGTSNRIASITPPGLTPVTYEYAGTDHRLARVKRDRPSGDPAGGTATLATIVYNVPTQGTTGLPDLTASAVGQWGQLSAPSYAAAVFGPDQPVATLDPSLVSAGDWASADITYTDARGYLTNTASHGAGTWQLSETEYNAQGNPIRELDEGDIAAIKNGDIEAPDAGTLTLYNTEHTNGTGGVTLPAGSVVTDTYETARYATLADGSRAWARPRTHTDYDQGAPNAGIDPDTGQEWALPTTETTTAVDPVTQALKDTLAITKTSYDDAIPGDATAGWKLGLAGSTTQVMDPTGATSSADITAKTRYDAQGRVVSTWQPKSNGTDAGTRQTIYYTAGTNPVTACGNKPAWDGALCQTKYAAAPTSGPALPTTTIASYNDQLQPLSTTEVANGATRTTTSTYRSDGAPATTATSLTGLSGSTSVPALTYAYSATTGLPSTTTPATGDVISTGYDGWGRQTSYAPASGETTTTGFDSAGRVKTLTDPKGTTTYTYDGTDSLGKTEHRGLATKIVVSNPGGRAIEVTGAYDAAGALLEQHLPGGITQRSSYDTAGDAIGLSYSGQVTIANADGTSTVHDDDPWLAWSQDNDTAGRVRREWTPSGAAFSGDTTGASGSGYTRDYGYDRASRLTHTTDRTTVPTGATDPDENPTTSCLQRDYTFDANGNRTSLARTPSATDGSCQGASPTGVTTKTSTYDNADRITTGYTYDALGRATTLPQTDTPVAAAGGTPGNLTLGYYDTDAAKTITQSGTTTNYTLDTGGRRATATTGPTGGTATSTVVRHYVDDSDNPGWTATTTSGTTTIERFAEALGGNLELTLTGTGAASLPIANIHGDIVSQTTLPTSGAATGLDSWQDSDEYGNPLDTTRTGKTPTNPTGAADGVGYGWLGAKQRATDTSGLLLMGARPYNPGTGQFTSTDQVVGGNTTAYSYPQDPINGYDLDGNCWHWCNHLWRKTKHIGGAVVRHVWSHRGTYSAIGAIGVCLFTVGLGCAAAGLAAAAIGTQQRHHKHMKRWSTLGDFVVGGSLSMVGFGLGKGAASLFRSVGKSGTHWALRKFGIEAGIAQMGYGGIGGHRRKKHRR